MGFGLAWLGFLDLGPLIFYNRWVLRDLVLNKCGCTRLPAGCVGGYCSGSVGLDVFGLWEIRAFGAFIDLSLLALFFSCILRLSRVDAGYWIFVPFILFHFIGLVTAAVVGFVRVPMLSRLQGAETLHFSCLTPVIGETCEYVDFGDKTFTCRHCNAFFWLQERLARSSKKNPSFSLCCLNGRVSLPTVQPTPPILDFLLDPSNGSALKKFRDNIRAYNSMFAFTSMGAKIDTSVNDQPALYVFKISGHCHHLLGSLLPVDGESPKFAQLYVFDTAHEVANRLLPFTRGSKSSSLDENIVVDLLRMLDETNELAKLFRKARDKTQNIQSIDYKLRLLGKRNHDSRQYDDPTSNDNGGLVVGDIGDFFSERDIIIESFSGHEKTRKRSRVSMRAYYAYLINERPGCDNTIIKGGHLYQQFLVDAFVNVEEDRLDYIRANQKDLRSEIYKGIHEAVLNGDVEGFSTGKIIVPSSLTGSPRYMINNYQDAMAICRAYRNPDLFITFTCNVNWPEIRRELTKDRIYKHEDKPDIITRVFRSKVIDMLAFIKSGKPFGQIIADVCAIEFQKRGLPHTHILIWLHSNFKCRTPEDVDSIVSAEIPDKLTDPKCYEIVSRFMMYGPCGLANPKSQRRDLKDNFVIKNGIQLNNRYVVPYNRELLLRYNAHINIEICCQSMLIKYLFKYVSKGSDRCRVVVEKDRADEIHTYMNCRFICPYEAVWRLLQFPIHSRSPPVERLQIHLPLHQNVVYSGNESLPSILQKPGIEKTMLTEWFTRNRTDHEARQLYYSEFPHKYVWDAGQKEWIPRSKGFSLGRLTYVHPASGELYFLRLLLNHIRGALSFDYLKNVSGVVHPTFQLACKTLGLLGDDKEWEDVFCEAMATATSPQIRNLFVSVVLFCDVADPEVLLNKFWRSMYDVIITRFKSSFAMPNLKLFDDELKNYVLYELELLFNFAGTSLEKQKLSMPDGRLLSEIKNKLLREELNYDTADLICQHSSAFPQLNQCQLNVYDCVVKSVLEKRQELIFVHGHGGTGKTFLWHTIINRLRSDGLIVLVVASSGIASLLLPGGRTAHSRFKIPLTVSDTSSCEIKKKTDLARLLQMTSLIVWDEAPMNNRCCFEALDRSLRDVLTNGNDLPNDKPFGGKSIL
ncbi:hypothetical protein NC653_039492 [Populus alba x Populus x berolinensis]|uniref:ATP-dependent DNA helicase n=1 Tax=Populus alba x Populus x berolinensis TaxID=444605 RepID=A0AAD6LDW3_9ROSI|nr:hypothetical protein NC653_039492 [Populus alba x Populus x berolinensis]